MIYIGISKRPTHSQNISQKAFNRYLFVRELVFVTDNGVKSYNKCKPIVIFVNLYSIYTCNNIPLVETLEGVVEG